MDRRRRRCRATSSSRPRGRSATSCFASGSGWWGPKASSTPDAKLIDEILKRGDWNDYEIRAEGPRIRLSINGRQTIDYTETDPAIPREGLIGLQIHGGGKAEAWYRDITIVELK